MSSPDLFTESGDSLLQVFRILTSSIVSPEIETNRLTRESLKE
jgi:hypothetical protein